MVRTAAETFFYNFNESKFFLDESKYLRVPHKVCTITTPPVDHLRIIDELYRGAEIYMTLYPQKPGTYFGAEICKCQWGCHPRAPEGDEFEKRPPVSSRPESVKLGFSNRPTAIKRGGPLLEVPGDGPPVKCSRSTPTEKILRMKKSACEPIGNGTDAPQTRKSRSSPGQGDRFYTDGTKSSTDKPLRMKRQKGADSMRPSQYAPADGVPTTGRSASRVTLQPAARAPSETQPNPERRPTAASNLTGRRRTTWGFLDMKSTTRSRSSQVFPQRPPSPVQSQQRETSPKKPPQTGDGLPNRCRKCTEKLCLKCRMPVDSCCCGIPNFLYCKECEENVAGPAKNVGDPFKCRKCDQKLCLVCRQHVDSCCCPKPNFFVCRSCETRRRTRCCIPIQR